MEVIDSFLLLFNINNIIYQMLIIILICGNFVRDFRVLNFVLICIHTLRNIINPVYPGNS